MGISQASIDALSAEASELDAAAKSPDAAESASSPPAEPGDLPAPDAAARKADLDRILHLAVPVSVTLAERYLNIETILDINVGTIVEFDVPFEADLTLYVVNQRIGTGQAVKIGEKFGLRVTKINGVRDRIEAMGGGASAS